MFIYEGNTPFKAKWKRLDVEACQAYLKNTKELSSKWSEWGRVGGKESRVVRWGQITSVLVDYWEDSGSESE